MKATRKKHNVQRANKQATPPPHTQKNWTKKYFNFSFLLLLSSISALEELGVVVAVVVMSFSLSQNQSRTKNAIKKATGAGRGKIERRENDTQDTHIHTQRRPPLVCCLLYPVFTLSSLFLLPSLNLYERGWWVLVVMIM